MSTPAAVPQGGLTGRARTADGYEVNEDGAWVENGVVHIRKQRHWFQCF